jgi:hypothetical protein
LEGRPRIAFSVSSFLVVFFLAYTVLLVEKLCRHVHNEAALFVMVNIMGTSKEEEE